MKKSSDDRFLYRYGCLCGTEAGSISRAKCGDWRRRAFCLWFGVGAGTGTSSSSGQAPGMVCWATLTVIADNRGLELL